MKYPGSFFKVSFVSSSLLVSSFIELLAVPLAVLLCCITGHCLFILVCILVSLILNYDSPPVLWTFRKGWKVMVNTPRSSLHRKILLDLTYWFGSKVAHSSCQRRVTKCRRNKLTLLCSSVTHLCPVPRMFSEPHRKTKYFLQRHRIAVAQSLLFGNDWSRAKSIILNYQWLCSLFFCERETWGGRELHIPTKGDFYL